MGKKNWTECECEELTLVLFHSEFAELQEIEGDVITLVRPFLLDGGGKADLVGTQFVALRGYAARL